MQSPKTDPHYREFNSDLFSLPGSCFLCGGMCDESLALRIEKDVDSHTVFGVLFGMLSGLGAFINRILQKKYEVRVPLCREHWAGYRARRFVVGALKWLVLLFVAACAVFLASNRDNEAYAWVIPLMMIIVLLVFLAEVSRMLDYFRYTRYLGFSLVGWYVPQKKLRLWFRDLAKADEVSGFYLKKVDPEHWCGLLQAKDPQYFELAWDYLRNVGDLAVPYLMPLLEPFAVNEYSLDVAQFLSDTPSKGEVRAKLVAVLDDTDALKRIHAAMILAHVAVEGEFKKRTIRKIIEFNLQGMDKQSGYPYPARCSVGLEQFVGNGVEGGRREWEEWYRSSAYYPKQAQ